MGTKISVGLSTAALVVALLGSTSAGRAALDAVIPVPLAKRAYLADTAKNAVRVNNIKASRTPTAGLLLPLDSSGKLPASVGAVGPKGDKGDKGDKGKDGKPGITAVTMRMQQKVAADPFLSVTANCQTGETVIGGGGYGAGRTVLMSQPEANGWKFAVSNSGAGGIVNAYAVCAVVG
jgi:hypothetical protein